MPFDPILATDRDKARFRLGDVGDPPFFPDETYDAILEGSATYGVALVTLAQGLAGKFKSLPSGSIKLGDQSIDYGELASRFQSLADELRRDLPINGARSGLIGCNPCPYPDDALRITPFCWP